MSSATKYLKFATVFAFWLAAPLFAGDDTCAPQPIIVSVVDLHGRPVSEIGKSGFEVRIDKKIVDLKTVTYKVQPSRMVILADISGSMGGSPGHREKWEITRAAVEEALSIPAPQVPIALIAFSNSVERTFRFGESRSAMLSWVDTIDPAQRSTFHRKTSLRDAIAAADQLLDPHQEGDSIYAITDGGENDSRTKERDIHRLLLRNHVRLYTFLLAEHTPIDEEASEKQEFASLVTETGGFFFGETSSDSYSWLNQPRYSFDDKIKDRIAGQTTMLIAQTAAFYRIELIHTEALQDDARLSVTVIGEDGKKRSDLLVRYPTKFFSCGSPSVSP